MRALSLSLSHTQIFPIYFYYFFSILGKCYFYIPYVRIDRWCYPLGTRRILLGQHRVPLFFMWIAEDSVARTRSQEIGKIMLNTYLQTMSTETPNLESSP